MLHEVDENDEGDEMQKELLPTQELQMCPLKFYLHNPFQWHDVRVHPLAE